MGLDSVQLGLANYVGVVVGGLAYFMLGGLWYGKLFRAPWVQATGRGEEEFKDASPGAGMLLTLVGSVVTTAVLAVVYHWGGGSGLVDGLAVGALLGVGVAAMEGLKTAVFHFDERADGWALYRVNALYAVCGLVLAGGVYGLIA